MAILERQNILEEKIGESYGRVFDELIHLNDEDRVLLFKMINRLWCQYCGRNHAGNPCKCWNDE